MNNVININKRIRKGEVELIRKGEVELKER